MLDGKGGALAVRAGTGGGSGSYDITGGAGGGP